MSEDDKGRKAVLAGLLFWIMAEPKRYLSLFAALSAAIVGLWVAAASSDAFWFLSKIGLSGRKGRDFAKHEAGTADARPARGAASATGGGLGDDLLGVDPIQQGRRLQGLGGGGGTIGRGRTQGGQKGIKGIGLYAPDRVWETMGEKVGGETEGSGLGAGAQGGDRPSESGAAKTSGGATDKKCHAVDPTAPMTSTGLCPPPMYKGPVTKLCYVCRSQCEDAEKAACVPSVDNVRVYAAQLQEDEAARTMFLKPSRGHHPSGAREGAGDKAPPPTPWAPFTQGGCGQSGGWQVAASSSTCYASEEQCEKDEGQPCDFTTSK